MIQRIATLLLVVLFGANLIGQVLAGAGIVYAEKHAFLVSAPDGWVLDNNAHRNNGLSAVFYPSGSTKARPQSHDHSSLCAVAQFADVCRGDDAHAGRQTAGVAGVILALPVNGIATGTANFITFSEVAFNFRITPGVAVFAVALAIVAGVIGGLLPAISAARLPITRALREI